VSRLSDAVLDWKRRALPFESVIGDEGGFPVSLEAARAWLRARGVSDPAPVSLPPPAHEDEDGILAEVIGSGPVASAEDLATRAEAWIDHADPRARRAGEALAARLMRRFEITKRFPAAYGPGWKSAGSGESWAALAHAGVVWLKLWRRDDDVRWLNAALNAAMFLLARQGGSGALPAGHRLPGTMDDTAATMHYARLIAAAMDGLQRVDTGDTV